MNNPHDQCQQTGPVRPPLQGEPVQGRLATPLVDVVEQAHRLYVRMELPGLRADQVEVRIANGLLEIRPAREGWEKDPGRSAGLVGSSPALSRCLRLLEMAAGRQTSVLLQGETGTGKELMARALHEYYPRCRGKFVAVDCTALPEVLVERLLFGSAGEASSNAAFDRRGLIDQAHQGTLFLDAVGELSLSVQATLFHLLQQQPRRPHGGSDCMANDFRVVATSRYDLQERAAAGRFHRDLLHYLGRCRIDVPALRERREDVPALALWHVGQLCHGLGIHVKALTPEFIDILCRYSWPGNVRELVNVLKQSLLMADLEKTLFAKHLPQHIRIQVAKSSLAWRTIDGELPRRVKPDRIPCLQDFRNNICNLAEKRYLAHLVQQSGSDTDMACQLAGLSRSRLYSLMKKHRITLH